MATIKLWLFVAKWFWLPGFTLQVLYKIEGWRLTMLFCLCSVSCLFYLIMQLQKIMKNQQDLKRGDIELKKEMEELRREKNNNDPNY